MRKCKFPECRRSVNDNHFCCRFHWGLMTRETREEAIWLLRQMDDGLLTKAEIHDLTCSLVARNPHALFYRG